MFLEISDTENKILENLETLLSCDISALRNFYTQISIIISKTSSVSVALLASSHKCLRANENGASGKLQWISAAKVHFNVPLSIACF